MSEYIGIRELCSLCKYGEIKNRDKYGELNPEKTVCCNPASKLYNMATPRMICTPCFRAKKSKKKQQLNMLVLEINQKN